MAIAPTPLSPPPTSRMGPRPGSTTGPGHTHPLPLEAPVAVASGLRPLPRTALFCHPTLVSFRLLLLRQGCARLTSDQAAHCIRGRGPPSGGRDMRLLAEPAPPARISQDDRSGRPRLRWPGLGGRGAAAGRAAALLVLALAVASR